MKMRSRRRNSRLVNMGLERLERRELLTVAYAFTAVTSFTGTTSMGADPTTLTADGSGNLYGTTISGGTINNGSIFKIPAGTNQVLTLASFDSTTGYTPEGKIFIDSSGNIFGTTANGGLYNKGTLWELASGSNQITTLWSFSGSTGGATPYSGIVSDGSGNLWGTTLGNGGSDLATVFEYTIGTGSIKTVGVFTGGVEAVSTLATNSAGILAMDSGNVFGTALNGGADNDGFLFSLSSTATPGTVINPLTSGSFGVGTITGTLPFASLLMLQDASAANVLVGITSAGGANGDGTIFEALVSGSTATLTQLASFNGTNGNRPLGSLVAVSGGSGQYTIYGTTAQSSNNGNGEVYSAVTTLTGATTDTATLNALVGETTSTVTFTNTTGYRPSGGIYLSSPTNLYVTTASGGAFNDGTIVQLTASAVTPPDHFAFTTFPSSATAGATLGSITVKALRINGSVDTSFTGPVSLSVLTSQPGVSITGTATMSATAGSATFATGLSINQAGQFTLLASDSSVLSPAQSSRLTINPGKATQIVLIKQPTVGSAGFQIGTFVFDVEDVQGNIVTGDGSKVNLTIFSGPGGGKITNGSASASKGIITLSTVNLSTAGAYTLRATDGSLPVLTLSSITIGGPATTAAITAPAAHALTSFEIDVTMTDSLSNPAAVGSIVTLTVTQVTAHGSVVGLLTAVVGSDGVARFKLMTTVTGTYNLRATDGKVVSPLALLTVTT